MCSTAQIKITKQRKENREYHRCQLSSRARQPFFSRCHPQQLLTSRIHALHSSIHQEKEFKFTTLEPRSNIVVNALARLGYTFKHSTWADEQALPHTARKIHAQAKTTIIQQSVSGAYTRHRHRRYRHLRARDTGRQPVSGHVHTRMDRTAA